MYVVMNMKINKWKYKIIGESHKIYCDMPTVKLREKLNVALCKPYSEDDMTGILGKYLKREDLYRIKYIFSRNRQFQPRTFDRYYLLADVNSDENGSFVEYVMVYDKLFEPIIRSIYILAAASAKAYLYYLCRMQAMNVFSAGVLTAIIAASALVMFKKSSETAEECKKAEKILNHLISDLKL